MSESRHTDEHSHTDTAAIYEGGLAVQVRRCWEAVLGTDSTGAPSDFLGSGGDSLRAAELCRRLQYATGRTLSPGWLLSTPRVDVETLTTALRRLPATDFSPASRLASGSHATTGITSFSQERMWFMHQLAPAGLAYNVSQALRLAGAVHTEALDQAVRMVVARHPQLRSRFVEAPQGLCWVDTKDNSQCVLQHIEIEGGPEGVRSERLRDAVARQARAPFDLANGAVFRAALISAGDEDSVLLLCAHHIVADQWAFDILVREISCAYNAIREGLSPQFAAPAPDCQRAPNFPHSWALKTPHPQVMVAGSSARTSPALSLSLSR